MTAPLTFVMPCLPDLAQPSLEDVKVVFMAICELANLFYMNCLFSDRTYEVFLANFADAFYRADSLEGQAHICQAYLTGLQQRLQAVAGGAQ